MRLTNWISVLVCACGSVCPAQGTRSKDIRHGETVYRVYCAVCHGETGRGDGPMSTILKVPVPDLTDLTKRNAGVFPQRRVEEQIRAEAGAPGHGTREMPIFGTAFANTGPNAKDGRTRLDAVIEYLKSIQRRTPAKQKPARQ